MNKFEPKNIHIASEYLQNKLNVFKRVERHSLKNENVYVVEPKKESIFKRLIRSLFRF